LLRRHICLFYRLCPACGCDGLVDHGGGHRECLICGYDSARDEVKTPREWLKAILEGEN